MNFREVLRAAKFGSVRPAHRLTRSGDLAMFAHLLTLRSWLDRADIDLVIDIGGNVGQFASSLRYIGYLGDIISFEPIPDVYAALAHRMQADKRWQGRQIGVGDCIGEAVLNVAGPTVYSSFLSQATDHKNTFDGAKTQLQVPVKTLASIIEEMNLASRLPRTFLKSDTQGYEMAVLKGAGDYIEQVKLIQCEVCSIPLYDGVPFMTKIIDYLHERDFKPVSFSPVNGISVRPIEFDYLCVNGKE